LKLGLTDDPTCERCLEEGESATPILCDCEAIAYSRFRHMDHFFMEQSDYYYVPINKVLYFIRSVALMKGLIKGNHIKSLMVAVQGADYYGEPIIHALILIIFIEWKQPNQRNILEYGHFIFFFSKRNSNMC
jgi:hypothetical protein